MLSGLVEQVRGRTATGDREGAAALVAEMRWPGPPAAWWVESPEDLAALPQRLETASSQQRIPTGCHQELLGEHVAFCAPWKD